MAGGRSRAIESYFAYLKNLAGVLVMLVAVPATRAGPGDSLTVTAEVAGGAYCACQRGLETLPTSPGHTCPD